MAFAFFAVASVVAAGAPLDSAELPAVAPVTTQAVAVDAGAADAGFDAALMDGESAPIAVALRFDAGLRPLVVLPTAVYAGVPAARNAALAGVSPLASSGTVRRFGAVSDLKERVQLIADQYDAAVWRPITMDGGGGGVQYRLKFGAKESRSE